ncbi:MAG TPA: outer membrane beta-barrel protein [Daejeonella sp.]|nr:outer membrane beta-barrel protein [Daejeonella sp.]
MKKLLLVALLATGSLLVSAQTKGTNTLGLGLGFGKQKLEHTSQGVQYVNEQTSKGISIGYGHFIDENVKMGVQFTYGTSWSTSMGGSEYNSKDYSGSLNYQRYYPIFKKFYAFGGGQVGYHYLKGVSLSNNQENGSSTNTYSLGVNGGLSWFLAKRLALEADLLTANFGVNRTRQTGNNADGTYRNTSTGFNLSTTGAVNGLGFKIYFLF